MQYTNLSNHIVAMGKYGISYKSDQTNVFGYEKKKKRKTNNTWTLRAQLKN